MIAGQVQHVYVQGLWIIGFLLLLIFIVLVLICIGVFWTKR